MKSFQTILLIVFGFIIVLAVLIFSGVVSIGRGGSVEKLVQSPVTLWGTMSSQEFKRVNDIATMAGDTFSITYVEKNRNTLEAELINALASDKGPDLLLAPQTLLIKQRDKFLPLSYTAIPERLYRDSFAEVTEILLETDNTLALPLYTDPIVMYWNRDMFSRAGEIKPPVTWLEVQVLPSKLTQLDEKGNIKESAVALGGINNIAHFKEILASQILQTGNEIISRSRDITPDGRAIINRQAILANDDGAESALRYYVQFTDPALKKYSWNSAMANSLDEFINGRLAIYFGFVSELAVVKTRNPHLNFDIAEIPRIQIGGRRTTYADVYSLAVLKNSSSIEASFAVAYKMAFGVSAGAVAAVNNLPPARRDLLAKPPADPLLAVPYSSAIIARTWDDPDSNATRGIFADMIESVTIGRSDLRSAVSNAETRIAGLLKKQ